MPLKSLTNNTKFQMKGGHNICQKMWCKEGHFEAMDGTTCSNGAWCISGKCTPDRRAPKAPGK